MEEMPEPIQQGTVYKDAVSGLYVSVSKVFVSEDGEPQIRARQYRGHECKAWQAVTDDPNHKYKLSLHADDIMERVLNGELEFVR